ncbi:MAG: serine/threonine-protein kinase pknB [Candidatus Peregrinibacteria bacterium Greene1014_49]|nr:MAG: serine/threonine-protein kinase pknB [Candidatus Peregrinibacteria bacterium Greene1014_49]
MEYIDGWNVHDIAQALSALRLDSTGRRRIGAERAAAHLLAQMLQAVNILSRNGVIHRDLKPRNLIVGRNGRMKVLDFGIATFHKKEEGETRITQTGAVAGTPKYMAPEAAGGRRRAQQADENGDENGDEKGDEQSDDTTAKDLFGVGATMHEVLTGRGHLEGGTTVELLIKLATWDGELPLLDDIHDRNLLDVLHALLSKDVKNRQDPQVPLSQLHKAGLLAWSRKNLFGDVPLTMPVPRTGFRRKNSSVTADQLARYWAGKFAPSKARLSVLSATLAASVVALIAESQTGALRSALSPREDHDRPIVTRRIDARPLKPKSPFLFRFHKERESASGQEIPTGIEEVRLTLAGEETSTAGVDIAAVRDNNGRLRAFVHGMSPENIAILREEFRTPSTGPAVQPQFSHNFLAPDGALAIAVPHLGLVCQNPDGTREYVWDVQWSQAMKSSTPPPVEIEEFFATHFPEDFANQLQKGDLLPASIRHQVPDSTQIPLDMTAATLAKIKWNQIVRACKLGTKVVKRGESPPQSP